MLGVQPGLEEVVVLHEDLEVLVRDDLERGLGVLRLGVGLGSG